MLNIGAGEMILILVVALLVLGPTRLPELARAVGKFVREFRRQTDDVRAMVEREFYQMDQDLNRPENTVVAPEPDMGALPETTGEHRTEVLPQPKTEAPPRNDALTDPTMQLDTGEPTQILGAPKPTTRLRPPRLDEEEASDSGTELPVKEEKKFGSDR